MRKLVITTIISVQVMLLASCATAWQSRSYSDDLYSVHDKESIAKNESKGKQVYQAETSNFNGYNAVLADSYESAYARRLHGFSSPHYRMPSSYYTWRYSDAFHYASAYDPAFYNIVVSGDMVWVEPKYITSMFGSWGASVIPSYGWYYGWGDPFYHWNSSYRYGWYCGWGWNSPYYWGWGYPYYPYHHHHPHHYPHHYPPYVGSGSVGNTGHHHFHRPGSVGRNPGASTPVDRGGYVRPSTPSSGRASQPSYRSGNSSSSRYNSGSSSYRSSGSSSYRSSGSSSTSRSYSSGSSSSSHSSYSGSGNSRGR